MQTTAVFDFDKTLTVRDMLWPFLQFTHGQLPALNLIVPKLPVLAGYSVGLISRQTAKETILSAFYSGMPIDLLRQRGKEFATTEIKRYLRPEAMRRLKWHQTQGHLCVLVSASIDIYLEPWAKAMGFHEVITSRLEVSPSGAVTGLLDGKNCWGPEKTRRLQKALGNLENYSVYAYGDSRGDRELLEIADHPYYRKFR